MKHSIKIRLLAFLLLVVMLVGCGSSGSDSIQSGVKQDQKNKITVGDNAAIADDLNEDMDAGDNRDLEDKEVSLDQKQKNSVAMLNYLMITTEQIRVSQNNRLLLDDVSGFLKNEIKPSKIDEDTKEHIENILGIIDDSKMNTVKRERLQYFYNRDKANAITKAVPNPLAVLSMTNALHWKRLATSVVYTAIDSWSSHKESKDEIERKYLIDNMELDDNETRILNKNSNYAWKYMVKIVNEYGLPDELALTEEAIRDFAEISIKENDQSKIQFLESKENIYRGLGKYWLELANCYYENKQYEKCLKSVEEYKELSIDIYRRDYDYANILPKAIVAAREVYDDKTYIEYASKAADAIKKNSKDDNWALRYFVAQVYLELNSKTSDTTFLNKAYNIALNNVNELRDEQKNLNVIYLSDIKEPEDKEKVDDLLDKADVKRQKEEEKELKKYYKALKKKRKTELPPLYKPLVLNCDLLFGVIDKIEISESEKMKIEDILQTNSNGVFLSNTVNDRYSFKKSEASQIEFTSSKIIIPVELLTEDSKIIVTVKDKKETHTFDDWKIIKVKRKGDQIQSFKAYFSSRDIKSYKWNKGAEITVEIKEGKNYTPLIYKLKVKEYKDMFLIADKIEFKQV